MKLRLTTNTIENWQRSLKKAGSREIGGVLFAEQLEEGDFRIIKASKQYLGGGSPNSFQRRGFQARREIKKLHKQYGGESNRFNYIGEWHSHPNVPLIPSMRDELTMRQLLAEQGGSVNFLVLAIIKLSSDGKCEIRAMSYLMSGHCILCDVSIEDEESVDGN